ncbi:hypothetical protein BDZ85DRAFT_263394 [Elsinoe ampelina]|uniref:Uncharacterized protein n=1 Tax=Elsinoe ampelina TaxID=302913 RepID=A0A6A6GA92_9PEZI|nr:hypothetical protein BDZ85DRAFT_263394 [Elsinoe ampelina]
MVLNEFGAFRPIEHRLKVGKTGRPVGGGRSRYPQRAANVTIGGQVLNNHSSSNQSINPNSSNRSISDPNGQPTFFGDMPGPGSQGALCAYGILAGDQLTRGAGGPTIAQVKFLLLRSDSSSVAASVSPPISSQIGWSLNIRTIGSRSRYHSLSPFTRTQGMVHLSHTIWTLTTSPGQQLNQAAMSTSMRIWHHANHT